MLAPSCLSLERAEQTLVARQTLRRRAFGAGHWVWLVCPETLSAKGYRWGPNSTSHTLLPAPRGETLYLFQDPAQSTTSSGKPSPNTQGELECAFLQQLCLSTMSIAFIHLLDVSSNASGYQALLGPLITLHYNPSRLASEH